MSLTFISDEERDRLLREPKPLVANRWSGIARKKRSGDGNFRGRVRFRGDDGTRFRLHIRISAHRRDDFAIVLQVLFRGERGANLVMCHGHHGEHKNRFEFDRGLPNAVIPRNRFHVHVVTERYQRARREDPTYPPDGYAETTREFRSAQCAYDFFKAAFGFYKQAPGTLADRKTPSLFAYPFQIDTFNADQRET